MVATAAQLTPPTTESYGNSFSRPGDTARNSASFAGAGEGEAFAPAAVIPANVLEKSGFAPATGGPATGGPATGGPATGLERATANIAPDDGTLAARRRAAFLNSTDSMSGIQAVRGLLADEIHKRSGGQNKAPAGSSIKALEARLGGLGPAPGLGYNKDGGWTAADNEAGERATVNAMSFDRNPAPAPAAAQASQPFSGAGLDRNGQMVASDDLIGEQMTVRLMQGRDSGQQVPLAQPPAPSGGLPQATVGGYLQSDGFKERLRSTAEPIKDVAKWQLNGLSTPAPRTDPGRDGMLAAFAAQGEAPPTSAGEAVLAAGAGNAFGTRGGQFKPGNTVSLGQLDPSKLPPLGRGSERRSNNYGAYNNPGNWA